MDIKITKGERKGIPKIDFDKLVFGRHFSDHMLEADFENGEWTNVEIKPYQPILMSPSLAALHYGQSIFEGIKAYKGKDDKAYVFRPHDNFKRFNISAERMQMPQIPEELFMNGMRQLINLDKNWIPDKNDYSLYIRPIMFASDEMIGIKPSENYKFLILLSPTGPYYAAPMRIYVEEKYTRAAPGGVGFSKTAGNYAASLLASSIAKEQGYDQVLWTDVFKHKYVQEIGTMNVFFIINNIAITPNLDEYTILEGITRQSAIVLLQEMGLQVEERPLSIDEIIECHKAGSLQEVFGTGTAATISMIKELKYKDYVINFNTDDWKVAPTIKKWLIDIRESRREDKYGWMWSI